MCFEILNHSLVSTCINSYIHDCKIARLFIYTNDFSFYAASFPRVAKCTFTLGRSDCHQDTDHNSNRSSCRTHFTRKCKNRVASISGRRIWFCSLFSSKQVSNKTQCANALQQIISWLFFAVNFCLLECSLGVLPLELNKLLIIVVVLSMVLTPLLNEAGRRAAEIIDQNSDVEDVCSKFDSWLSQDLYYHSL